MQYVALSNIHHDGVKTLAGELVELTESDAIELLKCKAIKPAVIRFSKSIVVPGTTK